MEHLIFLFGTHALGDFPFQSEWMVNFKGRDCKVPVKDATGAVVSETVIARWYEVLSYHVAVYVCTNIVFSRIIGYHPTPQGIAIDAATHFVIDTLKSRDVFGRRFITHIWVDQLCHLTVRTWLWSLGWL